MTEEILTREEAETATVVDIEAAAAALEKCTRPSVPIAVLRPRFRSNQPRDDQFTVEIASQNIGDFNPNHSEFSFLIILNGNLFAKRFPSLFIFFCPIWILSVSY